MAILPQASVTVANTAAAFGGGTGYIVVMGCVGQSADSVPRVASSTAGLIAQYGYAPAVDYAALHMAKTRQPVIFIGMPITTAGTIGPTNNLGVTGTSQITVTAGPNGVLEQVTGVLTVTQGTTIGTDQIIFNLSCDGGYSTQTVRLSTNTSYTIPYLGLILNFGAGTLNVGDVLLFQTQAPMWGSTAISAARTALAGQQNLARSWLVVGDLPNSTFANYVVTEANNYNTANQRFTYARTQVTDRSPLPTKTGTSFKTAPGTSVTFAAAGKTITRTVGSFVTDGFAVGQVVTVSGSALNNGVIGALTGVTALVLTFTVGTVVNEGPITTALISGSEGLTFATSTITRAGVAAASWLLDGFAVGQSVTVAGTTLNNGTTPVITVLTATVMTFGSGLVAEGPLSSAAVTVTQNLTFTAWTAAQTAAFATIDAQKRIDLALGRGIVQSPITGWNMRRPAAWAASLREYRHDLQIPCWRKADGPLGSDVGFTLTDVNGNIVEFDERYDGGGLAGRFTCMRSYGNGPLGAFIALSLTRDTEGSLMSRTHNMAVVNLGCQVVQAETENAIGQVLLLNSDGTGTDASLSLIEARVNSQLQVNLLQRFAEGPRASSAVWKASRTDILNVPGATLNGTLLMNLNGTLEQINTSVVIQTAGT